MFPCVSGMALDLGDYFHRGVFRDEIFTLVKGFQGILNTEGRSGVSAGALYDGILKVLSFPRRYAQRLADIGDGALGLIATNGADVRDALGAILLT